MDDFFYIISILFFLFVFISFLHFIKMSVSKNCSVSALTVCFRSINVITSLVEKGVLLKDPANTFQDVQVSL